MRQTILLLLLFLATFGVLTPAHSQIIEPPTVEITSPVPGGALQGIVPIVGNTDVEGAQSWQLYFGYADDVTDTWFLIADETASIKDDTLAEWDTTKITDSIYNLRLIVHLENDEPSEFLVQNVRVRNYTPIETSTPRPTTADQSGDTLESTQTPIPPTLTPLPTNPIVISSNDFSNSLSYGAIIALVLFLLIGLYISIRKTIR
ncbi:MAG: hypothetical protein U9Q82_14385 [Chloroflexota bacterium]|nr:hypothetical protein [Chloroflexota bacterium]